jgi:hypothetical protein
MDFSTRRYEASLATFPDEFRQAAGGAVVFCDTGKNHPDNWVGGLAGPESRSRHSLCP